MTYQGSTAAISRSGAYEYTPMFQAKDCQLYDQQGRPNLILGELIIELTKCKVFVVTSSLNITVSWWTVDW